LAAFIEFMIQSVLMRIPNVTEATLIDNIKEDSIAVQYLFDDVCHMYVIKKDAMYRIYEKFLEAMRSGTMNAVVAAANEYIALFDNLVYA